MPSGSVMSPSFSRRVSFPSQSNAFLSVSGVNCLSRGSVCISSTLNPLAFMADGLNQRTFRFMSIIHTMSVMCSASKWYNSSLCRNAASAFLRSVTSRTIPLNPIGLSSDESFSKDKSFNISFSTVFSYNLLAEFLIGFSFCVNFIIRFKNSFEFLFVCVLSVIHTHQFISGVTTKPAKGIVEKC